MATPHVTGLVARVLAHHPDLRRTTGRDGGRVGALFNIMRASARPVIADAERGGFGLPHAPAALAAAAATGAAPPPPHPAPAATVGGQPQQPVAVMAQIPPLLVAQIRMAALMGDPYAQRLVLSGLV